MAPRAYWKGFLRLSLVSCPIQLFPATSEREKISFNQVNRETGNRIRYRKVDEESGEEVPASDIVKAYQVDKGQYVEINDEELEAIALESRKSIDIDEFVPKSEIDDLYHLRPYYIVPDGDAGTEAFAVIRSAIDEMDMVAIGRVVLTSREHVIAMQPRGKGIMGMLLRYPYEIRGEKEYFDDIPTVKITRDMMELAQHIVKSKSGHFEPEEFEDHYEAALKELVAKKAKGIKIVVPAAERTPTNVVNLMDALRRSIRSEQPGKASKGKGSKRSRKRIEGQKEMLFSIPGKKAARQEAAKKPARARRRKAG